MKSKNKVLLIALMFIASLFCSSCIIIHDWDDDESVYIAETNYYSYKGYFNQDITNTGFNREFTSTKTVPTNKIYTNKRKEYWTENQVRQFIGNHKADNELVNKMIQTFYSQKHCVIDFMDDDNSDNTDNTVYTISR